jgi:hypothetical protein
VIFLGFIIGAICAAIVTWVVARYIFEQAANKQIDEYKQRWLSAVKLMQQEGQLTDKQVAKLLPAAPKQTSVKERSDRQKMLDEMFSEDRAELAVERAKKGLPPEDDLKGMYSEDIVEVEKARVKYAYKQSKMRA